MDGLLARLEAHIAEQQRLNANASHELRTPLAITRTLLDVARHDPAGANADLVDRLQVVKGRAIDLAEALLLLTYADQRSFTREYVDVSLIAEEATETLLALAEERGLASRPRRDHPHHRLARAAAADGAQPPAKRDRPQPARAGNGVGYQPAAAPDSVVLTVENTGEQLTPQLVSTLSSRFNAPANVDAPTTQASA